MAGKKKKYDRKVPDIAKLHSVTLIAKHGIEKAEIIAKLTLQKIKAQRKAAENKYGKV